jgi:hypothetical protein
LRQTPAALRGDAAAAAMARFTLILSQMFKLLTVLRGLVL